MTIESSILSEGDRKIKFGQEKIWIPWRIVDYNNNEYVNHTGLLFPIIHYILSTKNKETILNYLPNSSFVDNNELCAKNIGILGYRNRFNPDSLKLEPLYLRKSEAEQKMEEQLNAGK